MLIIVTIMCNSLSTFATVTIKGADGKYKTFTDVNSADWYHDHVKALVVAGIIDGYNDSTFKPSKTIQVDEFLKTMVVALGYNPGNGSSYWAQLYIDKALSLGIIKSTDFSSYNKPITRAEMAMICENVLVALEGSKSYTLSSDIKGKLMDYSSVASSGYENNILHVYELGIITGYPDGTFGPNKQLMRSEASTVIRRIIDASVRKPFEMIDNDIARLATYARDTSGSYQPSLQYKSSQQVQADIDFALGWVEAIYNFDYRTTSHSEYRSTLEWYYSPSIGFGGKTADVYLDWLYNHFYDDRVILEAYAVSDISLPYASSDNELIVPVTIYYRYQNTLYAEFAEEMNEWYKYDTELSFIRNAEYVDEADMWEHSYIRFAGADDLSNSIKVGD